MDSIGLSAESEGIPIGLLRVITDERVNRTSARTSLNNSRTPDPEFQGYEDIILSGGLVVLPLTSHAEDWVLKPSLRQSVQATKL